MLAKSVLMDIGQLKVKQNVIYVLMVGTLLIIKIVIKNVQQDKLEQEIILLLLQG